MNTYENNYNYRKIYENHFGKIPVDELNRTYHIHHVDGDRNNNDISNLIAVSIEEHLAIHKEQNDWGACLQLQSLLKYSHDELSISARNNQLERVKNGTHHFCSEFSKKIQNQLVAEGRHHLLGGEVQREIQNKRVKNGTHNFQDKEKVIAHHKRRFENGTHQNLKERICPICERVGHGPGFTNHINACKRKSKKSEE